MINMYDNDFVLFSVDLLRDMNSFLVSFVN